MTDEERGTFLELHEVELRAAGDQLARDYHEQFCQMLTEGIREALDNFGDETDHVLLMPGLMHRVHETLAGLNQDAASLWEYVFFTNLKERYDETGEA